MLKRVFTWWNGATIGTFFTVKRLGALVGEDEFGNRYFEAKTNKNTYDGRKRRWVIYNGYADASKVPPDWHGWLHHTFAEPPTKVPLPRKRFEIAHVPNLSGTEYAYRPKGSQLSWGQRPAATGDYVPWTPGE